VWNRRPGAFLCWRASSSPNRTTEFTLGPAEPDPGGAKRASRLVDDRSGTSALEFAIIAPVLFALLFGLFQLGWALHCNQSVDWAVQNATRQLVATPTLTQPQLQSTVQSLLTHVADPSSVTVSLTEDPAGAHPQMAHVSASYVHTIEVPFLPPNSYTYNTSSTMVLSP
jgi:Flp pilus assembly protein TadG